MIEKDRCFKAWKAGATIGQLNMQPRAKSPMQHTLPGARLRRLRKLTLKMADISTSKPNAGHQSGLLGGVTAGELLLDGIAKKTY